MLGFSAFWGKNKFMSTKNLKITLEKALLILPYGFADSDLSFGALEFESRPKLMLTWHNQTKWRLIFLL